MSNSDNPRLGAAFQNRVLQWFENEYHKEFISEKKIPIGNPPKDHKFDIASADGTIVIECKRYTWTEGGNVPSAKMGTANEAAFYLSFLPDTYEKYIVMLKAVNKKKNETLAEYYYRTNRHLLGKIKVAEYDPGKNELHVVGQNEPVKDSDYLIVIRDFLESKGLRYSAPMLEEIKKRNAGKHYSINDHIRGMIYSLLTNQTKWSRIEPHLPDIDMMFNGYDPDETIQTPPTHYAEGLFKLKCGNMSTKAQMEALADNIQTLLSIEKEYGSIDSFITSASPNTIVEKLSNTSSPYKLKMMGEALVWEYLRNVGVDGAKPDTHLRRFFGADRMGTGVHSPATINEVSHQIEILAEQTGMRKVEIDNIIWSFCADGFGEICTATPKCEKCPINGWCKASK